MRNSILLIISSLFIFNGCLQENFQNGYLQASTKNKLEKLDYKEWRNLLSGNTVILNRGSNKIIWLLSEKSSNFHDDAIEINVNKKTVIDTVWGKCAGYDSYLCLGSAHGPLKNFSNYYFVNSDKTKFYFINDNQRYVFHIIKGWPKKYIQLSKSPDYKHIKNKQEGLGGILVNIIANTLRNIKQDNYTNSHKNIHICKPPLPAPYETTECNNAQTSSGKLATIKLRRAGKSIIDGKANCFDLYIYTSNGFGSGNTCDGINGNWSIIVNGQTRAISGFDNAITWVLEKL